jgi:hypothetical protein
MAAKKIVLLCTPWVTWKVSGTYVLGDLGNRTTGAIVTSDHVGLEILSLVPLEASAVFLTVSGQSYVSPPRPSPVQIYNLKDSQVESFMQSFRSTSVCTLRAKAPLIFGSDFKAEWFPTQFNRASVLKLQEALGVKSTPQGKKYHPFPPILYPGCSAERKLDIFLAPALINVSNFPN